MDDIRNEKYILPKDGLQYEVGEILDRYHMELPVTYQLDDDFAVQKMVESGLGITVLPRLLLYNTPFDVCVRPFTEHYVRTLGIAVLKENISSPVIEEFVECAMKKPFI